MLEGRKETIPFLDNFIVLSVITEMELLGIKNIPAKVYTTRKSVLDDSLILPFDEKIKDIAITLKQKHSIKIPDSIIAATAIKYGIPLISADKALAKISNLDLILLQL